MKRLTIFVAVVIALSAFYLNSKVFAQQEGMKIEAPSEVTSGEKFKIVVTYDGEPLSNADVTFEGAVVEPTKTNSNGVATITAPNVTKPTKLTIHVKGTVLITNGLAHYEDVYDYVIVTVLPTKEVREKEMIEKSTALFKGEIKIAGDSYWSGRYDANTGETLIISIKTDGSAINEFVLDRNSYSNYLENKKITADDYYQFNVIEGVYILEVPYTFYGEWYVVLENPHEETVSVSIEISKTEIV